MTEEQRIEAGARALCIEAGDNPDQITYAHEMKCASHDREPKQKWEYWIPFARAAITAIDDPLPFHSFKTGDRVHHTGRKEDGTVEIIDGNVQVTFDIPTARGNISVGLYDANWLATHQNWLIPIPATARASS